MKKLLTTIALATTLFANCEYYNNEFNNSKIKYDAMITADAPYSIVKKEQNKILYYLDNALVFCNNKEYYKTLIKFYGGK